MKEEIIKAKPTDGLWNDNRNDEKQLGLTYKQIEEAMKNSNSKYYKENIERQKKYRKKYYEENKEYINLKIN